MAEYRWRADPHRPRGSRVSGTPTKSATDLDSLESSSRTNCTGAIHAEGTADGATSRLREKGPHIGSNFDEFLAEDGLLDAAELVALKRVIAYQVDDMRKAAKLSKQQMARRMKTSRAAVDRLLEPEYTSITLQTLGQAAHALGATWEFTLKKTPKRARAA